MANKKTIVTSFRANQGIWKKLKIASAIEGVAIQDKLNEIIEDYVNSKYGHLLSQNITQSNDAEEE